MLQLLSIDLGEPEPRREVRKELPYILGGDPGAFDIGPVRLRYLSNAKLIVETLQALALDSDDEFCRNDHELMCGAVREGGRLGKSQGLHFHSSSLDLVQRFL